MDIDVIVRRPLLSAVLGHRSVSHVEVKEIVFKPGQKTPRHLHPCPVVGYIAEGTALYRREGQQEPTVLETGAAFYEPADTVMVNFDNASETEPMKFIAFYLLEEGDQELIEILPVN
jgi:quercetin dioxygenase-like cupin family protein